jgi:hypothetical protein
MKKPIIIKLRYTTQKIKSNVSPSMALRLHRPALSLLITLHGVAELVDMLLQLRVQMLYHVASAQRAYWLPAEPLGDAASVKGVRVARQLHGLPAQRVEADAAVGLAVTSRHTMVVADLLAPRHEHPGRVVGTSRTTACRGSQHPWLPSNGTRKMSGKLFCLDTTGSSR